jgi:hypothetical protein
MDEGFLDFFEPQTPRVKKLFMCSSRTTTCSRKRPRQTTLGIESPKKRFKLTPSTKRGQQEELVQVTPEKLNSCKRRKLDETLEKLKRKTCGEKFLGKSPNGIKKFSHLRLSECDEDRMHREVCKEEDCERCRFADMKAEVLSRLQLCSDDGSGGGSWVITRLGANGKFLAGCKICKDAKISSIWGRVEAVPARISEFLQHARGEIHCRALEGLKCQCPEIINGHKPPPTASFKQCLEEVRRGRANSKKGIPNLAKKNKVRKYKHCLAEAFRVIQRRFIKKARTMSLQQDVRKGWLQLRFKCCNLKLEVKSGCFGQINLASEFGSFTATAVADGTNQIISNFSSKFCWTPFRPRLSECQVDKDKALEKHIKNITEVLTTDAAADETRAMSMLKKGLPGDIAVKDVAKPKQPLDFENVLAHTFDRSHALRRPDCPIHEI